MPRRIVGLFFLAPWVGEYLLGNISVRDLVAIPFLAPMYGGGALLIREVTRRTGRGWPTILLLGAAYGVIEAGLVDQSLFNPTFEGHAFQEVTPVPELGISGSNTLAFVVGHACWSIAIPIAIVELLTPTRREVPWLGRTGLLVTIGLYCLGCWIIFDDLRTREGFLASPAQLASAALAALVLIVLAMAAPPARPGAGDGRVPRPVLCGVGTFAYASLFMLRPETWPGVAIGLFLVGLAAATLTHLGRQRRWTVRHRYAVVSGGLLTYAWLGFVLTALFEPEDPVRWYGNVAFAVAAVVLVLLTGRAARADESGRPAAGAGELADAH